MNGTERPLHRRLGRRWWVDIDSFHMGYDAINLYLRVDMPTPDAIEALNEARDPDLALYFMQPNAQNFNEVETNFRTITATKSSASRPRKWSPSTAQLRDDGQAKWNLFDARGKGESAEQWALSGVHPRWMCG